MSKFSEFTFQSVSIFGLSFLSPQYVPSVFKLYARCLLNPNEQLKKFLEYLHVNYTGNAAVFRPSLWSGVDGKATNNGAEAFHRHFGDLFGYLRCKPTIWHFLKNIKRSNFFKDIKMRSSVRSISPSTEIEELIGLYIEKKITVRSLLYKLSKKNQPKFKVNYKRRF